MLLKNESRRFEDPCLLASLVCLGLNSVPLSLLSLDSFQKSILLFLKIRFLVTISDLSSVKYARCVTQRMRKIRLPTSVEARKGTLKKLCLINMQKKTIVYNKLTLLMFLWHALENADIFFPIQRKITRRRFFFFDSSVEGRHFPLVLCFHFFFTPNGNELNLQTRNAINILTHYFINFCLSSTKALLNILLFWSDEPIRSYASYIL